MIAETNVSRLSWVYAAALAAAVVWASGHGQVAAPSIVNFDKAAHFGVFGLMATLAARPRGTRPVWLAVAAVSLFGATDELHQSFTPGRSMDYHDWMADTLGAAFAVWVYVRWGWYRRLMETRLWRRKTKTEAVPATATAVSAT